MLAFIQGHVIDVGPQSVIVMAGGIGYELLVFNPAQYQVEQIHLVAGTLDHRLTFWVWTVTVQEQPRMYGFTSAKARQLAIKLSGIDGMGPTGSARLVQSTAVDTLVRLIADGDAAGLCKLAKGLGDKKAKAIIAALSAQIDLLASACDASVEDLQKALRLLGHDVTLRVCADTIKSNPNHTTAQRVSVCLATLRK